MTSRAHVYKLLQQSSGAALTGATIRVYQPGTTTNITDTLYSASSGVGTLSQGFTSASGLVEFWLANPQRVDIGYTPSGGSEVIVTVDAVAAPADTPLAMKVTAVKTGNYTAVAGDFVPFDLTSGSYTLTMPTTPVDGTRVGCRIKVQPGTDAASTKTVTPTAGGSDVFEGGAATFSTLLILGESIVFTYRASDATWVVTEHGYPKAAFHNLLQNTQTASYTLVITDVGRPVEMNVASACTLTVPPNSSVPFAIGDTLEVLQYGAGQVTITPGAGVTLRSDGGKLKTNAQYASATLRKRATDEWIVAGDLTT